MFEFELEGVDELAGDLSAAIDDFGTDLREAVMRAGESAVQEMQQNHPYQDQTQRLTGGMQCRQGRQTRYTAQAEVTFEAPYAKYVNDGTVKSRAYPFLPQGMRAAELELERCVDTAIGLFCTTLGLSR